MHSADNTESSSIIMITIVFDELLSAIHDGIISAVADAVTRTITSYTSPFYDMMTVTSCALPSYNIDSSSSTIYNKNSSTDSSSSTTIANDTQYDYYYGDSAVLIVSPSIVIHPESSITFINTEYPTVSVPNNNVS